VVRTNGGLSIPYDRPKVPVSSQGSPFRQSPGKRKCAQDQIGFAAVAVSLTHPSLTMQTIALGSKSLLPAVGLRGCAFAAQGRGRSDRQVRRAGRRAVVAACEAAHAVRSGGHFTAMGWRKGFLSGAEEVSACASGC